jgi:hypothetical protein
MSYGYNLYRTMSAASDNARNLSPTKCKFFGGLFYNVAAEERYLKLYDTPIAPVSTDVPKLTILIPGATTGAGNNMLLPDGVEFMSGLGMRLTTGMADGDTTIAGANEVLLHILWR